MRSQGQRDADAELDAQETWDRIRAEREAAHRPTGSADQGRGQATPTEPLPPWIKRDLDGNYNNE